MCYASQPIGRCSASVGNVSGSCRRGFSGGTDETSNVSESLVRTPYTHSPFALHTRASSGNLVTIRTTGGTGLIKSLVLLFYASRGRIDWFAIDSCWRRLQAPLHSIDAA